MYLVFQEFIFKMSNSFISNMIQIKCSLNEVSPDLNTSPMFTNTLYILNSGTCILLAVIGYTVVAVGIGRFWDALSSPHWGSRQTEYCCARQHAHVYWMQYADRLD